MQDNNYLTLVQKQKEFENGLMEIIGEESLTDIAIPVSWSSDKVKPIISSELLANLSEEKRIELQNYMSQFFKS